MKNLSFTNGKPSNHEDPPGSINNPNQTPKTSFLNDKPPQKLSRSPFSKIVLVIGLLVFAGVGSYLTFNSRAETVADSITVSVDRSTSNGTSNWVPAHTSVSTEFYHGSSWPNNQGPDTLAGTAQFNARSVELEGVSQHNLHIMAWGRHSPWLNETDGPPDPNLAYNSGRWGGYGMDQEIKRAADKGLQPTITLAMAPGWMVGKRTSGNGIITPMADFDSAAGFYQARVTTDKMDKWLQLVDSIVKRYSKAPYNVRTYDIWNEFKGFYNSDINNYDAGTYCGTPGKADIGYTCFYNKTRAQILASAASVGVTSGIRTGGPYVVGDLWDQAGAGGFAVTDGRGSANNTLSGAKSYGWVDGRPLDAIKTWLANKSGAEFIALRFSNETRANTVLGSDWNSLQYAGDLAKWVRGLPEATYPGASSLPFWNAEHYTTLTTDTTIDAKKNAFSAESYRVGVRGGYEAMLRWGADGLDGVDLWTTTSVPNNHELRAGNGLPGNAHAAQKLFKQHFSKGTALYPETISDSTKISALASKTHTLLINKTNTQLIVSLDGSDTTLSPYGVVVVAATTTPPPPTDTTAPTTSLTAPTVGATISNTIQLTATANDAVGVTKVEFYQGTTKLGEDTSSPYAYAWDTKTVPNGSYSLTTKAYDAVGNVGTSSAVTVTVNNATADTILPVVTITAPASGATVSGNVTISAKATDNVGVTSLQILIDDTLYASTSSSSLSTNWNTKPKNIKRGAHTIVVKAKDAAGNIGSKTITVTVK